jgi:hypothetical protein
MQKYQIGRLVLLKLFFRNIMILFNAKFFLFFILFLQNEEDEVTISVSKILHMVPLHG